MLPVTVCVSKACVESVVRFANVNNCLTPASQSWVVVRYWRRLVEGASFWGEEGLRGRSGSLSSRDGMMVVVTT